MMAKWMRGTAVVAAFTAFAAISSGYYHYLHYTTSNSPYSSVPEKFDLNVLPNKAVNYFVSQQQGGAQFASGDSLPALVTQIRAAAKVWNDVDTSELRLRYGGVNDGDVNGVSPAIEVMLGELPPGLVGTTARTLAGDSNGSFVPVAKAVIVIRQDLHDRPSYGDSLFGTIVHEFGHALGLQHTFTGSVMSTLVTRSTSRSKPLGADDVAGISLLYPAKGFASKYGSISGRVTTGSQGVHLASVVALAVNGPALSGMTNPDGTFRIDGVPAGEYLMYVAPLPPAQQTQGETTPGNVTFPIDLNGKYVGPSGSFDTVFYPATRNPQDATKVTVSGGSSVTDINFSVRSRTAPAIHSIAAYSYPSSFSVKPAYLNATMQYPMIAASGVGLTNASGIVGGFNVSVIGGAPLTVRPFPGYTGWAVLDVDPATLTGSPDGPRHLLFTGANDIYILPAGYWQAQNAPPSVTSVSFAPDSSKNVILSGTGLRADTKVWFDGVAAVPSSVDDSGRLVVSAPQTFGAYKANVVASNSDGQSSAFVQDPVPTFTFDKQDASIVAPFASVSPSALPAASTAQIDISSPTSNFVDGQVWVGFGSPDVTIQKLWIVDSTTLRFNVSVVWNANPGLVPVTVVSGLQTIDAGTLEITPANPKTLSLVPQQVVNIATGQPYIYPGAGVGALIAGRAISGNGLNLWLDGKRVQIIGMNGNQLIFQLPVSQAPGLVSLRVDSGSDRGNPILINIEPAPPQIVGALNANHEAIDSTRPAHAGDTVVLQVTGLGDPGATISLSRVTVSVGSSNITPSDISWSGSAFQVTVALPKDMQLPATGAAPVAIAIDGRTSSAVMVNIR